MSEYKVVLSVDEIATKCPKCGRSLAGTYAKEIFVYFTWCKKVGCSWAEVYFIMR